jgi:outer membrane autotransporter protein
MRHFAHSIRLLLVAAVVAFAVTLTVNEQDAMAQNTAGACTSASYSYTSNCTGNGNAAGATVVGAATTSVAAQAALGLIQSRVHAVTQGSNVMGEGISTQKLVSIGNGSSGLSAGEAMDVRMGIWANGSYLRTLGDKANAKFDSTLRSGAAGADYRFGEATIVGLSGGYERNSIDTKFNNGKLDDSGWTVSPYASFGLTKLFSIDAVFGYSQLSYDSVRPDPNVGGTIRGSFDSTRYMGDVEAVANWELYNWRLSARGGVSYIQEDQDAYRETNGVAHNSQSITIGTGLLGGRVGYVFALGGGATLQPYVGANYGYDFDKAGGTYDDPNTYGGAIGLSFGMTPNLSLSVEGVTSQKEDLSSYGGNATLRLNF